MSRPKHRLSMRAILMCITLPFLTLQILLLTRLQDSAPSFSPINLEEEIQKSRAYVNSIKDTKRSLIFVHIPKTAGTTLEDIGGTQLKIPWGSCLFNHRPYRKVCKPLYPKTFEWPMKIGYWHLPPHLFPIMDINPYEGADLFAVVRDPRERLLSEFYWICRKKIMKQYWDTVDCNRTLIHDPKYLNQWLQNSLNHTKEIKDMSASDFLFRNGHFTPQYDFIVSQDNVRMVDYVLQMNDLENGFNPLMKAYGLNAILPPKSKQNIGRNDTRDLLEKHFDASTNALIEKKYKRDFDLLVFQKN